MRSRLGIAAVLVFGWCILAPFSLRAQTTANEIENLFTEQDAEVEKAPAETNSSSQKSDLREVSDLGKLAPFEDIAVIQKRYLPKTGRFEFFGGPSLTMNDPFFLGSGFNGRLGYYFRDKYGLELVGWYLGSARRTVTKDLATKKGVNTYTIVTPKYYYGMDFKWVPIYGKMAWSNRSITHFDLYFSVGGGMTATNQNRSEGTVHLGTGQVFALSKSMAFRWDFSWNLYQATSASALSTKKGSYNNLFLTIGASFFFPEATYR